MQTYQSLLQYELIKLIQAEMRRLTDNLVTSHSNLDFPSFKYQVGQVEGLKKALELVEEAESIANGADKTNRG